MIDGTPNFHRIYDTEITKNIAFMLLSILIFSIIGILKLN